MTQPEQGPLEIGSQFLEKYEVRELVGRGGFAWVYHGYDPFMDEHVAIKIIHRQGGEGVTKDVLMRGRTEARTLKKANHPNIVKFFDAGMRGTSLYIVMELLPGHSLYHVLRDIGRLTVDEALAIFAQLADGIAAAHELGAIHRDIKPANIFITQDNVPKVLDFGIAKAVNSAITTRSQGVLGTIAYISPEQLNGMKATVQSDMYSFGIMLYEALAQHPCRDDIAAGNVEAVGWFHATRSPPRLDQIDPAIPEYLALFVHRLIAKIPDQRFRSMLQVADQLRSIHLRFHDELLRRGGRLEAQRDLSGTGAPRSMPSVGPPRPSVDPRPASRPPVPQTLMGMSPVPQAHTPSQAPHDIHAGPVAVHPVRVAAPIAAAREVHENARAPYAAAQAAAPVRALVEPSHQPVPASSIPAENPVIRRVSVEQPSDSVQPRTQLRAVPEERHDAVATPAIPLTSVRTQAVLTPKGPTLLQVLAATVVGGTLLGVSLIYLSVHRGAASAPAADSASAAVAVAAAASVVATDGLPPPAVEPSAAPAPITTAAVAPQARPAPAAASAPAAAMPPAVAARAPRSASTTQPITPPPSAADSRTIDRMEQSLQQLQEELRKEKAAKAAAPAHAPTGAAAKE